MATVTYPGVYVEELPEAAAIWGVPTSDAGFIGRALSGPVGEAVLVTSWPDYVARFGGAGFGAMLPAAVYAFFRQGGAVAHLVRAAAKGERAASGKLGPMQVEAAVPGAWGNDLAVQVSNAPAGDGPETPVFALTVLARVPKAGEALSLSQQLIAQYAKRNAVAQVKADGAAWYVLESYPGLTAADLAKPAETDTAPIEARVNDVSAFVRVSVPVSKGARPGNSKAPEPLQGGVGDTDDTPLDFAGALQALDRVRQISLLAAPDVAMIEALEAQRDAAEAVLHYCETRRGVFAILDVPYGLTPQKAVDWKTGAAVGGAPAGAALNSDHGALYYPWIEIANPHTPREMLVPPSGAMAGTYVACDQRVGVWKSPAGVTDGRLSVASGLERAVTDTDQDVLNPNGINAIRSFAQYGIVAWGARTLSSDPDWTYIAVRRLVTYIEQSLSDGLGWVVFEPSTPALWTRVERQAADFLTGLWRDGALFGANAGQAFYVTCGPNNNTPADIAAGRLNVDVGVAPLRPAEFALIQIQMTVAAQD